MADFIARHAPQGTDVSDWRGREQPPQLMLTRGRRVVDEGVDAILPNDASPSPAAKNLLEKGATGQISRSAVANRKR
jgi:hypothetical protein